MWGRSRTLRLCRRGRRGTTWASAPCCPASPIPTCTWLSTEAPIRWLPSRLPTTKPCCSRWLDALAHATGSIADAVAAGADSVEHCSWISPDDNIVYAPAIAEEMAARGVYACPTTNFRLATLAARRGGDWLERRLSAVAQMRV